MTVYILHGKPFLVLDDALRPLSDYDYYMMLEQSEINCVEVLNYD